MIGQDDVEADEEEALAELQAVLPPPPTGEVWIGDDAAVLGGEPGPLLFATDLVAEGVHFDRSLSSLADVGWKVLATNLSDIAAMGGRPLRAVVAFAGTFGEGLRSLYVGLAECAERYVCPLVGGDLSAPALGGGIVCSVAILGSTDGWSPVLRSGARPGDELWVTGPLGASAAGLRQLRADPDAIGDAVDAHRRPVPRLAEGTLAATLGASSMIDISDGLGIDLDRLARASSVGVELDAVPVAAGATVQDAIGGGEDYELVFSCAEGVAVAASFAEAGLRPPVRLGRVVADSTVRTLHGSSLPAAGYVHRSR